MIASFDFPGLYTSMGIDENALGCIMLDTEPLPLGDDVPDEWAYHAADGNRRFQGFETAAHPHVTLLFGLLKPGEVYRPHVDAVLEGWQPPQTLMVEDVISFPTPPSFLYNPVVLSFSDETLSELEEAHDRLRLLPHVDVFSDYHPHVSVGFVKKEHTDEAVARFKGQFAGMNLQVTTLNYGR